MGCLSVCHTSEIQPRGPALVHSPSPSLAPPPGLPSLARMGRWGAAPWTPGGGLRGMATCKATRAWLQKQPSPAQPILPGLWGPDSQGRRVCPGLGSKILSFLPPSESPTAVRVTSQ